MVTLTTQKAKIKGPLLNGGQNKHSETLSPKKESAWENVSLKVSSVTSF